MTLDGVIQAPGGPEEDTSGDFKFGGWTYSYFDDFAGQVMAEQMKQPFSLLLGRTTFEIFAGYWPHHADQWPGINESKKYVLSTTLTQTDWQNSAILQDIEQIKKLKTEDGPNLQVYGSSKLVQTLMKYDLVDEYWLKIFPITLGEGKRLFEDGTIPAAFKLTETKISPSGVIFANYTRSGDIVTGSVG